MENREGGGDPDTTDRNGHSKGSEPRQEMHAATTREGTQPNKEGRAQVE